MQNKFGGSKYAHDALSDRRLSRWQAERIVFRLASEIMHLCLSTLRGDPFKIALFFFHLFTKRNDYFWDPERDATLFPTTLQNLGLNFPTDISQVRIEDREDRHNGSGHNAPRQPRTKRGYKNGRGAELDIWKFTLSIHVDEQRVDEYDKENTFFSFDSTFGRISEQRFFQFFCSSWFLAWRRK